MQYKVCNSKNIAIVSQFLLLLIKIKPKIYRTIAYSTVIVNSKKYLVYINKYQLEV